MLFRRIDRMAIRYWLYISEFNRPNRVVVWLKMKCFDSLPIPFFLSPFFKFYGYQNHQNLIEDHVIRLYFVLCLLKKLQKLQFFFRKSSYADEFLYSENEI